MRKEPKEDRLYEKYQSQGTLTDRGTHENIEYCTKKDREKKEKAEQRYILKQIADSLKNDSNAAPPNSSEIEEHIKGLADSLESQFGTAMKMDFQEELQKIEDARVQWKTFNLWCAAPKFHELLSEAIAGEVLRFFLGNSQPKTRIVVSDDLKLFISSKEVKHKEKFWPEKNQHFLKHYAAGLIYNLLCRNVDLHSNQILITEDNTAIFIDFGYAFTEKRYENFDTPSMIHAPLFNSEDIHYQPFVGPNAGLGGSWMPYNWLGSYAVNAGPPKQFISQTYVHDWDVCTYQNPRFEQDKHRAILKMLLAPESIFREIVEKNKEALTKHFVGTDLLEIISERIKNMLLSGRRRFMTESAKIPDFIQYLRNITLFDLAEIAREFCDFTRNNKRYKIFKMLNSTYEMFFEYCLIQTIDILENSPFNLSLKKMPLGLRYYKSLEKMKQNALIQGIIHSKRPSAADFFTAPSPDPEKFMAQFCVVDQLFITGELDFHGPIAQVYVPHGLQRKLIQARLQFITRTIEAKKLISRVIDHFTIDLFRSALEFIADQRGKVKPPEIPTVPASPINRNVFLHLEPFIWQSIIREYFPSSAPFNVKCMANNLLSVIEKIRLNKIQNLTSLDYRHFSSLLPARHNQKPHERLILNALLILEHNPNLTELERITLELANQVYFERDFLPHHQGIKPGSKLHALVSALINLVFGFNENEPDYFNLDAHLVAPYRLKSEESLREFIKSCIINPNWIPKITTFLRQSVLEMIIAKDVASIRVENKNKFQALLDELKNARTAGDAFRFVYHIISKLEDFAEQHPSNENAVLHERNYYTNIAREWLPKPDSIQNLLQALKDLLPSGCHIYDNVFKEAKTIQDQSINLENLRILSFFLLSASPDEQKYLSFWIRLMLEKLMQTPKMPESPEAKKALLDRLRFLTAPRHYANLIEQVSKNPILYLHNIDQNSASHFVITCGGFSETEQEQFFIIESLLNNNEINEPIFKHLKNSLSTIELKETSAEFIFELIESINRFSKGQGASIQEKIENIVSSLLYALPFQDKAILNHTVKSEPTHPSKFLMSIHLSTHLHEKYSHHKNSNLLFSAKLVTENQKEKLITLLSNELQRLDLLSSAGAKGAEKISERKSRLSIAKSAIQINKNLTWLNVDLTLRELARDQWINNHRNDWKNRWNFFKTDSRKAIDKIFECTVQLERRASSGR